jgi:WNK lysine deficient protein kinase
MHHSLCWNSITYTIHVGICMHVIAFNIPICYMGTMNHMSPEMLDGSYDEAVDIYAFGMCLYELATGKEPYSECKNMGQVVRKITLGEKPIGLQTIEDDSLREIILACISPVHSRPSASELLQTDFFSGVQDSWEDLP